jgi:uncharacterized membrane protein YGL010W
MQASFYLFGLAMPLALLTSLVLLWNLNLSIENQKSLLVLAVSYLFLYFAVIYIQLNIRKYLMHGLL